jgi:hypothetical protein
MGDIHRRGGKLPNRKSEYRHFTMTWREDAWRRGGGVVAWRFRVGRTPFGGAGTLGKKLQNRNKHPVFPLFSAWFSPKSRLLHLVLSRI